MVTFQFYDRERERERKRERAILFIAIKEINSQEKRNLKSEKGRDRNTPKKVWLLEGCEGPITIKRLSRGKESLE